MFWLWMKPQFWSHTAASDAAVVLPLNHDWLASTGP